MELLDQNNSPLLRRLEAIYDFYEKSKWHKIIISLVGWACYFYLFWFYIDFIVFMNKVRDLFGFQFTTKFFYLITHLFSTFLFFYVLIPKLFLKKKVVIFWIICALWFFFFNTYCFVICYEINWDNENYSVLKKVGLKSSEIIIFELYNKYGFWAHLKSLTFPFGIFLQFTLDFSSLFLITTLIYSHQNFIQTVRLNRLNFELESKYLQQQLNPHFLFNSLNNIYGLILQKSGSSDQIITKFQSLLGYSLNRNEMVRVRLDEEVKFVIDYLELEKIRHGKNVKIVHNLLTISDLNQYVIAPFIFTTFIENAFKHGIHNEIESAFVNINLAIVKNKLTFIVQNSFPLKTTEGKQEGGIGLKNVQRRLNLLYPSHSLKINKITNLHEIELEIKL